MRRSRLALLAGLILALLVMLYVGAWFYLEHQVRQGLLDWAEARRVDGYTVGWDRIATDGFPGAVRVIIEKPVYGKAGASPGYEARAPILIGEARPWALRRWHVTAPQGARLAIEPGASRPALTFEAASADVTVEPREADQSGPAGTAVTAVVDGIAVDSDVHLAIDHIEARAALPRGPVASHLETWFAGQLHLTRMTLPEAVPPLGDRVDDIALRLRVKGTIPPGNRREALAAWRQDGGTLEVDELGLAWGQLHLTANGTLALDAALQPEGALSATIAGYGEIVDAMVAGGTMKAGDATLAKLALGLLAKQGADGVSRITAPVAMQNGRLFIGPARLLRLPHFTWE
jgi:hypothetical protein